MEEEDEEAPPPKRSRVEVVSSLLRLAKDDSDTQTLADLSFNPNPVSFLVSLSL